VRHREFQVFSVQLADVEDAISSRQGPMCLCFAPAMPSPLRGFEKLPLARQMHSLKVRLMNRL
jgi:hypothetical protein